MTRKHVSTRRRLSLEALTGVLPHLANVVDAGSIFSRLTLVRFLEH
jgi:hypothetical protein